MPREVDFNIDPEIREPHYEGIDPGRLRVFEDGSGRLRLTVRGERCYVDVKVAHAFPFSVPDRYVGFLDSKDKLIATVPDLADLDAESRQAVQAHLRDRYFAPTIRRVLDAREEYGAVYCEVDTNHGPREFVARGIRDSLRRLANGQMLLTDVDGNRYRVPSWEKLDEQSRRLLERII